MLDSLLTRGTSETGPEMFHTDDVHYSVMYSVSDWQITTNQGFFCIARSEDQGTDLFKCVIALLSFLHLP